MHEINSIDDRVMQTVITHLMPASLSDVPFHQDTDAIVRHFAANFPLHLAVHEVSPVKQPPEIYTEPHIHADFDEVNIILSPGTLVYRIQLDDREDWIYNNAAIWIPRGTLHAANVQAGSGYFITMRAG